MADVIQFRRDTASNWTSANPTLASGEFGYETDTGKIKIGTGALAWNSLGYSTLGALGYALLASPTFTGTVTGPTINASTALQIGGAAVTSTAAELNLLDGVTSTTAELNILDGVTSTTAELNILDGVTSTAAELNKLDGVTSTTAELNILDGVTSTAAELNKLDGVTATTAELNILDGVTSTAAELNILDGVTATTAELNYVDGVTSAIQTQIDNASTSLTDLGVTSTAAELNLLDGVSGLVQADLTKLAAIDADASEINKLDALARGSILYGHASGVLALAKGSTDQVLTSGSTDISWVDPAGGLPSQSGSSGKFLKTDGSAATWQTAPGASSGSWVYLQTVTASGASTADLTSFSTTYEDFMIVCNGVIGSTGSTDLRAIMRENGSWHTLTSYYWHCKELRTSSASYAADYGTTAYYLIFPTGSLATGVNDGLDYVMHLPKCYQSGMRAVWTESGKSGNTGKGGGMFGNINRTGICDGFRFFASSGNISGVFKLYGLAKS